MTEALDEHAYLRLAAELAGVEAGAVVPPQPRDADVGGLRLRYWDWGGPDGAPAVVFLHGFGLTGRSWDLVCLALREQYRCLALDLRGHGDSDWSDALAYGPDAVVADVRGLLQHLQLGRVTLVGQSYGGIAALVYAGQHGSDLDALVLVDAGPEFNTAGVGEIARFADRTAELRTFDDYVEQALTFNPRRDRRLLRTTLQFNLRQLEDGSWTWKYDQRHLAGGRTADPEAMAERQRQLWAVTAQVTAPTLVLRGADSPVFLPEVAHRVADTVPDGRVVEIEGAGHTVQGDNPAALVEALRGFLHDRR